MYAKRLLSITLSVLMLASSFVGINVSAGDTDNASQGKTIVMDFTSSNATVPTSITGTNFGQTYDDNTYKVVTNATIDTTENALKIDATNGNSSDAYVSIPLVNDGGSASISTDDGTFAITVTMKLPQSNANPPLRGFPILSDNDGIDNVVGTEGNTVFGLAHMGNESLMTAANGTYNTSAKDTCWLRKGYAADKDYDDKKAKKDTNQKDTTNLGDGTVTTGVGTTDFLDYQSANSDYYDYKWIIDPASETFKLWYKKSTDEKWTQAYGNRYMINPKETIGGKSYDAMRIVRYSELGMMPTGTLPTTISHFKLRQMNAGSSSVAKSYYIKSIKVEQNDAVAAEYKATKTAGKNNMEFGESTGSATSVDNGYTFVGEGSATVGDGYLKYTSNKNKTNVNMPNASGVTIPLDTPIVTRNGKFVIETRVNFANPGAKRPIRSFPALTDGTNVNAIGVSWGSAASSDNFLLQATAYNNADGMGLTKTWNSKQLDNANNINSDNGSNKALNSVKDYTKEDDIKIAKMTDVYGKWYSYRLEIDPYSETYKFAYRNDDNTDWIYPYTDKYFANPNKSTKDAAVYYEEPGIMPTGKLPSVISAMRLMENTYETSTNDYTHQIDYIKTYQDVEYKVENTGFVGTQTIELKTSKNLSYITDLNNCIEIKDVNGRIIPNNNYTVSRNELGNTVIVKFNDDYYSSLYDGTYTVMYTELATVDGEKITGTAAADLNALVEYKVLGTDEDCVSKLTTGTKANSGVSEITLNRDSENMINWTNKKTNLTSDSITYLDFDFDDIAVDKDKVEVEFTVKLPDNFYRLCGFPKLVDVANKEHDFGFDTATPNNAAQYVEQYLFRQLGVRNMVKKGGFADSTANLSIIDHTSTELAALGLKAPVKVNYGKSDGSAVGASLDYYDFKFVIDPIAKEYRYYQRKSGESVYNEIFAGMPGYPIAIDDMPTTISKLRFYIGRNTANKSTEYTGTVSFKSIAIRTTKGAPANPIASRIINRSYAIDDGQTLEYADDQNTTTNATTKATITAKLVNYNSAPVTGRIVTAIYKGGVLVNAVVGEEKSIQSGISEETFTFDAPESTWTHTTKQFDTGNEWDNVTKDTQIYKIFLWTSDEITPLANAEGI